MIISLASIFNTANDIITPKIMMTRPPQAQPIENETYFQILPQDEFD